MNAQSPAKPVACLPPQPSFRLCRDSCHPAQPVAVEHFSLDPSNDEGYVLAISIIYQSNPATREPYGFSSFRRGGAAFDRQEVRQARGMFGDCRFLRENNYRPGVGDSNAGNA